MIDIDEATLEEAAIDLQCLFRDIKSLNTEGSKVLNALCENRTVSYIISLVKQTGRERKIRQSLDGYVDILQSLIYLIDDFERLGYTPYTEEELYSIFVDKWGETKAKTYAYNLSTLLKEINDDSRILP